MTSTSSLFQEYFGQLQGLPCWEADTEYTCWLTLRFGQPNVRVREGNPESTSGRSRRRQVYVVGDFQLFFEMGEWEYFENGKRRYHSGQSRLSFRRMSQRLQSQCLIRVELVRQTAEMVFEFDLGGLLQMRPSPDAKPNDWLWNFSAHKKHLTMRASGKLEFSSADKTKQSSIKARPTALFLSPVTTGET